MKYIIPVITEKSTALAKDGKYTFLIDKTLNKFQIKHLIGETFKVTVRRVNTIKVQGENKKTLRGRIKVITPTKKVIVVLDPKDKIDLFEEGKQKKTKKT